MEFWLSQGAEKFRLPVPPAEYAVGRTLNNSAFMVENIGEVSFIGKSSLLTLPAIETFFPNHNYSFCQYSTFPKPNECVALINKWMNSGKPIRYLITGTSVNTECTIESFEYKEKNGTGNIYFTLELREYKRIILEVIKVATKVTVPATPKRVVTKVVAKTYTVKKGDNLWDISKKVYGNSLKWRDLYNKNKNKIKNPDLIYPGQVLTV